MESDHPVIIGTDLSAPADEALREGAAWARRAGAPLIACHVHDEQELKDASRRGAVEAALKQRVAAVAGPAPGADIALVAGSPHSALIRLADARQARMVVVGASGAGGLAQSVFGSTAEQVVRYARCPVLVVRPSPEGGPILAGTDFSDSALPAVEAAVAEARQRGARLAVLHALHVPLSPLRALGPLVIDVPMPTEEELEARRAACKEMMESSLEAFGATGEVLVVDGRPGHAIVRVAGEIGAALVVVGTMGRTGLERVAMGSVTEHVVRHAPCSVLAVRLSRG